MVNTPDELNAPPHTFLDPTVTNPANLGRDNNALMAVTPDNPPWGLPGAAITWIASVVFLFVIQTAAILVYAVYRQVPLIGLPKLLTEDSQAIFVSIISIIPAHLITLLVVWAVVTRFGKYSFSAGLGLSWGRGFNVWNSSVLALVLLGVGVALTKLLPGQETALDQMLARSIPARYAVAILATFTAPLVEELVYRGVIYPAVKRPLAWLRATIDRTAIAGNLGHLQAFVAVMKRLFQYLYAEYSVLVFLMLPVLVPVILFSFVFYIIEIWFAPASNRLFADDEGTTQGSGALPAQYGTVGAILAVMLLFTVIHVPQYWPNIGVIATIALLSFFLTFIRAYTRRTLPSIAIHTVFNGIQSVLIVIAAYTEQSAIPPPAPTGFVHSLPFIGLLF